jgi:hypothetical protein
MSKSVVAHYDDEALNDELPDAAVERAGSKLWEGLRLQRRLHFAQDWTPARPLPENKCCL